MLLDLQFFFIIPQRICFNKKYFANLQNTLSTIQFFFTKRILFSNEQKINSPFGDKDFVPRLDEQTPFVNRLRMGGSQKIIGEMMKLFFTRYLA